MLSTVLVEVGVTFMVYNVFFEKKTLSTYTWLLALLLSIMAISFVNYNVLNPYAMSYCILAITYVISYLFDGYFKHRVLITILLWSFFLFTEYITVFFMLGLTKSAPDTIFMEDTLRLRAIIIAKLFLMIIAKGVLLLKKNTTEKIATPYWLLLMIIPLFSVFTISVVYFLRPDDPSWQTTCGLVSVGLLICNLVIFSLFESALEQSAAKSQCDLLTQQIQYQVNFYKTIEQSQKELIHVRHDINNHLLAMGGLLRANAYQEALDYVDTVNQIIAPPEFSIHTGNVIFDALINEKMSATIEQGIEFYFDVNLPQNLLLALPDWCIIFGNALDNAIEACLRISDGPRIIHFVINYNHHNLICIITNSTNDQLIPQGSFFKTSKDNQNEHGLGLRNIAAAVARYNGNMNTHWENREFRLEIVLYEV